MMHESFVDQINCLLINAICAGDTRFPWMPSRIYKKYVILETYAVFKFKLEILVGNLSTISDITKFIPL